MQSNIKATVMKFSLNPDTLTIVKVPSDTSEADRVSLMEEVSRVTPNCKVFVVDESFSIDRLSLEEAIGLRNELEEHINAILHRK